MPDLHAHRITTVINTRYAVGDQTGRLCPIKAGFACGSMVLVLSCSQKNPQHDFFVNKIEIFHPAGGETCR